MSKRIVVTGAAGFLGRTLVATLKAAGMEPVGIDLIDAGPDGIAFLGGIDLTQEKAVTDAFKVIADSGSIGGLVNVAGGFTWETVADSSAESWDRMFRMNVLSAANTCRAALAHLGKGASIVNLGAAAASKAGTGMGVYTAAKSGVARLTEALAEECKERGIRVNAVLPSVIDTPANRDAMGEADAPKWVKPAELAEVIVFLLSDAASGVTGASIPVVGRV